MHSGNHLSEKLGESSGGTNVGVVVARNCPGEKVQLSNHTARLVS